MKEGNIEEVATTAAALALEEAERKRKKEDKAKRSRKRAARNNSRNVPVRPSLVLKAGKSHSALHSS